MTTSEVHWIREIEPLRLAMMSRPRSGEWLTDDVVGWFDCGLRTVVSLLEPQEVHEFGLDDESLLCRAHGLEFISFPIRDRAVPASFRGLAALVDILVTRLRRGVIIGLHCRAGIGRSGLVAGCILLKLSVPFPDVFPMLSRARGSPVPDTRYQAKWVKAFGKTETTAL
ncbi:MAG: hypothetical protein ACREUA_09810 [Burkholderiales bacterium]